MIADIVRGVAADRAEVVSLMGSGVDPHLYKPIRSDMATLLKADAVFYNGLLLEGKMTDALVRVATSGRPVYAVTELLDEQWVLHPDNLAGHADPHVWMDPSAWIKAVDVVRDRLCEFDTAGADEFKANAGKYAADLKRLDEYAEKVLASVPEQGRVLVTAHDAFNYFGRGYGDEVIGIKEISTVSEAGVRDNERWWICSSRAEDQSGVRRNQGGGQKREGLVGAQAKGHKVAIGGELFSDAMEAPGTSRGRTLGMIDHNVTVIARGLGGRGPREGHGQQTGGVGAKRHERSPRKSSGGSPMPRRAGDDHAISGSLRGGDLRVCGFLAHVPADALERLLCEAQ